MSKVTVSRDGIVRWNETGETIGSVLNTIPGWMATNSAGKTEHYMYWRTQAGAVDFLVRRWERIAYGD
jgi:hypothetical protein